MKGATKEGKQFEIRGTNRWICREQSLLRCCSVFPSPLSDLESKDDWNTHQGLGEIDAQAAITPAQNTGLKQFKAKRKLIWCAKKSLINWGRTSVLSVRRGPTSVWCPAHDERNALQTRRLLTAFTYTHTEEETQITAGEPHLYPNASI